MERNNVTSLNSMRKIEKYQKRANRKDEDDILEGVCGQWDHSDLLIGC